MTLPIRCLCVAAALFGSACGGGTGDAERPDDPLLYPKRLNRVAPDVYRAYFETSAGDFTIEVHRAWASRGADRFYNLVANGYYDDTRIYRVVDGFMAQWGIHGTPLVDYQWQDEYITDDPVVESNTRGRVAFAMAGRHTRTTEIFISYRDNSSLDRQGFAPFGEVVEGMDVVDSFYSGYGDGPPRGDGPYQAQAHASGNEYFDAEFPNLDRVLRVTVEPVG